MNEILSKIDDFLAGREIKEKVMIYLSLLILFIIVYYYFNYSVLYKKMEKEKSSISNTTQQYDLNSYKQKLKKEKNIYLNLKSKIDNSKKNLAKINFLIKTDTKPKLIVKEDDLFYFLQKLFNFSISKYLFPSYKIDVDENNNTLKSYTIQMKGRTYIKNFNAFIDFLGYMEKNNFITTFNRVEFNISVYHNEQMSDYNATFKIWSFK